MTSSHPLVESTFAAARIFLFEARRQQQYALAFASNQYLAGPVGRKARRLYQDADRNRSDAIGKALDCRRKAKRLRAELARMCTEDTLPPEVRA